MNLNRTKTSARSLLVAITLALGVSISATPMAQAVIMNYYRDYVSGVSAADWNDANAAANDEDVPGAVNALVPSAYPWMKAPLTRFGEYYNAPRYIESYVYEGYALYNLYLYYALSSPAFFDYYLSIAVTSVYQYAELVDALEKIDSDEDYAVNNAWADAQAAAPRPLPADVHNYPRYLGVDLYGGPWLDNDASYAFQKASYGYNLWVLYGAPYYALSQWFAGVAQYFGSIGRNLYESILYDDAAYSGFMEQNAAAEAALEPYEELAIYWRAYEDYYRGLSDFYEG